MYNNFNNRNNHQGSSYFSQLIEKARASKDSKKLQKLKNDLIKYGTIAMVCGFVGVAVCFITFGVSAFNTVQSMDMGFPSGVLIPFFLFMPCGLVGVIGSVALRAGLSIAIGEKAVDFLDVNTYCPKCNTLVADDEKFCDNCGENILSKMTCTSCSTVNKLDAKFCKECGKEL